MINKRLNKYHEQREKVQICPPMVVISQENLCFHKFGQLTLSSIHWNFKPQIAGLNSSQNLAMFLEVQPWVGTSKGARIKSHY